MKKHLLSLSVLVPLLGTAHAQSTVTLYGLLDTDIAFANNVGGHQQYEELSGGRQSSRWGLKGTEDLGAGMKTIFLLENGFSTTNGKLGQGGDEFGRKAYMGISSDRFGTITLGRQYDSIVDYTLQYGPTALMGYAHPGDLDNFQNTLRVNNSIKFQSVNYAGLTFGGVYSFGGLPGKIAKNQIWSLGAGYEGGPLTIGVGYLNVRDPNFSFFGNNATSSTTASNMSGSPLYSGYASARTQQIIAAGGVYHIGASMFGVSYSNTQFRDLGAEANLNPLHYQGNASFNNFEADYLYQLNPALSFAIHYDYTKAYSINNAGYHQAMIFVDYFISKRTDIFVQEIFQHASGKDSTGATAQAVIGPFSPSSTANQLSVQAKLI